MAGDSKEVGKKFEDSSNEQVIAVKSRHKVLQTNPFQTYRDPETGRWIVEKLVAT